jgi:hypothetical protein
MLELQESSRLEMSREGAVGDKPKGPLSTTTTATHFHQRAAIAVRQLPK